MLSGPELGGMTRMERGEEEWEENACLKLFKINTMIKTIILL